MLYAGIDSELEFTLLDLEYLKPSFNCPFTNKLLFSKIHVFLGDLQGLMMVLVRVIRFLVRYEK